MTTRTKTAQTPSAAADKSAHTPERRVLYSKQCRTFADNSVERCALCLNHPGEHNFPVTAQRDELLAACKVALVRLERLDDAGTGQHSPAYKQIDAAIAKAEYENKS